MITLLVGDLYPTNPRGVHARHEARIVAINRHGVPSWEDPPAIAPTLTIQCGCGAMWRDQLVEAVAS